MIKDAQTENKPPIILCYGEKAYLSDCFEVISYLGKIIGYCATIDLSGYQKESKPYYLLLRDILEQIGDEKTKANVQSEWEKAIADADIAAQQKFFYEDSTEKKFYDKSEDTKFRRWADDFAKHGTKPFLRFLSTKRAENDKPVWILLNNFESVTPALQIVFERYLIPQIEEAFSNVKFFIFCEGILLPSWSTYNFERFIHPFSRFNKKLEAFENPYIAGRPIRTSETDTLIKRKEVIKFIEESLNNSPPYNVLFLAADRRMGKTSLLMNLGKFISEKYIPVFLDVQKFDMPKKDKNNTAALLERIAFEVIYKLQDFPDIRNIQSPQYKEFCERPNHTFEYSFLKSRVFPVLGDLKLVLLFDEIKPNKQNLEIDFFQFLLNLVQNDDRLAVIFTSTDNLLQQEKTFWSSVLNSVKPYKIEMLNKEEAINLTKEPVSGIIDYEQDAIDQLYKYSGQHPYFIQLMCFGLVNRAKRYSRATLKIDDVNAVADEAVKRGEDQLNYLWNTCSETEKRVLIKIVNLTASLEKCCSQNSIDSGPGITQTIEGLEDRDILRCKNNKLSFQVGLFYRWIKEKENKSHDSGV